MSTRAALLTVAVVSALAGGGCGAKGVEGHYTGTADGKVKILGISFPINGIIEFDLVATGEDRYDAAGDMTFRSGGEVRYEATLDGYYRDRDLNLSFTAKDGKSSGSMAGDLRLRCFKSGSWSITGVATSGSGSWEACR